MKPLQVKPVGADALLVEVADTATALALAAWARSAHVAADEVVPGARTVLFDGVVSPEDLRAMLAGFVPGARLEDGGVVEVPVTYDGEDLDDVAVAWGTDRAGVVARHTSTSFRSAFCGFSPGFAYLSGLPDELAVSRLETPRPKVLAGAVGLAGSWCGVYPTASPGGWRVIGRTDLALWDPAADQPAVLAPGTRVRFVAR